MKLVLSLLIASLSLTSSFADPITATVVFENLTEKMDISGVFSVTETNQKFEISALDNFNIELPKKGKYQFRFYSEDVNAYTFYPVRITETKNIITIRLESKTALGSAESHARHLPIKDLSNLSVEDLEEHIANGTVNFITHGLVAPNTDDVESFKNEFGIGFISENCVIDPISYKTARSNNSKIAIYLTSKFGNAWKNKLPAQPFGI